MQNKEAKDLLSRYIGGDLTDDEEKLLNKWYFDYVLNSKEELSVDLLEQTVEELRGKLLLQHRRPPLILKLIKRTAVVSSVAILICALCFYFYNNTSFKNIVIEEIREGQVEIAPGKYTATLTLSSGKVIHLDSSKKSVVVTDSVKTSEMVTAHAPRGGMYQIILPDSTNVWLNSESAITFSSDFNNQERRLISASGEVYFDVKHNAIKPFIVYTEGQSVEVLGTHFNLQSYPGEGVTKTTLLEGSIQIDVGGQLKRIKPEEQATLIDGNLSIKKVQALDVIAWKEGFFMFDNETLEDIMLKISRWYNVDVKFLNENIKKDTFLGSISRFEKISTVLKTLERTGIATFNLQENTIVINKK